MKPIETVRRFQPKGYYGIGCINLSDNVNIGSLFRTAQFMGASYVYTVGNSYVKQKSDTGKSWRNMPCFHYENMTGFLRGLPKACKLVGVEISDDSISLPEFKHPESAIYLLGNESEGLPTKVMEICDSVVHILSIHCLNVAIAGSIVVYDRIAKMHY